MSTAEEVLEGISGALPPYFVEQYEKFLRFIKISAPATSFHGLYTAHAQQKTPEEAIAYACAILEALGWEELDDLQKFVDRGVVIDTSMNEELKHFQKFEDVYEVMGKLGNQLRDHQLNRYRLAVTVLERVDTDKSFVDIFTILRQKLTLYPLAVAFTIKVLERSGWGGTRELKKFALPKFDLNESYPVVDLCLTVADYYSNMSDTDFSTAKTFTSAVRLNDMNVHKYNRVDFTLLLLEQHIISVGDVSKIKDDRRYPLFFKEYERRHKGIIDNTHSDNDSTVIHFVIIIIVCMWKGFMQLKSATSKVALGVETILCNINCIDITKYFITELLKKKYNQMKDKFRKLLFSVISEALIKKSLDDVKQCLVSIEPNMNSEVEAVKDEESLRALLQKYCFLSNISLLKCLARKLNLTESKERIDELNDEYRKFSAKDLAIAEIEDHEMKADHGQVDKVLSLLIVFKIIIDDYCCFVEQI